MDSKGILILDDLEIEVATLPEGAVSRIDGKKDILYCRMNRKGIDLVHFIPYRDWAIGDKKLKIILPGNTTSFRGVYGRPSYGNCDSVYWTSSGVKYSADAVSEVEFGEQ